jgi:hypothetical protein
MSKLVFPNKPVAAVDWDGTCVYELYPGMGDWLPGAKEGLMQLTRRYHVYINSARFAPVVFQQWHLALPPGQVENEIAAVRKMLDDAGLKRVDIWTSPFKIPAKIYIDDRAIHFTNWSETMLEVKARDKRTRLVRL